MFDSGGWGVSHPQFLMSIIYKRPKDITFSKKINNLLKNPPSHLKSTSNLSSSFNFLKNHSMNGIILHSQINAYYKPTISSSFNHLNQLIPSGDEQSFNIYIL